MSNSIRTKDWADHRWNNGHCPTCGERWDLIDDRAEPDVWVLIFRCVRCADLYQEHLVPCTACDGDGFITATDPCAICDGDGDAKIFNMRLSEWEGAA